jgi:DNA phosphorothioation system restriction enzyme
MSETLDKLAVKISYRTDRDNLVQDFYGPCMKRAILYQRAVGYFTSHGLAYAAAGVAQLIGSGGRIELVASPQLTHEDIDAIQRGQAAHEDVVLKAAKRGFHEIADLLARERLEALAWMVATGALEVKLALRVRGDGSMSSGVYHEKAGIFTDAKTNRVAFSGSANETASGLFDNFEAIDVYCSWDDTQGRVLDKVRMFDDLWQDKTTGLSVIDFTEATADILRPYTPTQTPSSSKIAVIADESEERKYLQQPSIPSWLELREYQHLAIKNWFENNGRGTLKMATGSGKTITALSILALLYRKAGLSAAIVVCPYKHLVDQWAKEARNFNFDPLIVHTSKSIWADQLSRKLLAIQSASDQVLLVLTTNASFANDFFQRKLQHLPSKTVIIADEAHNLGAKDLRSKLPSQIRWRLALSATPERWFDDEGTSALFEYFGNVLQPEFTLKDALESGALSPYLYYPVLVEFTDEEQDTYLELSEKIARIFSQSGLDEDNPYLSTLLIKRARLMSSAANKIPALKRIIKDRVESKHWLFYCGDGRVEDPTTEEEMRQIESVCRILGRELHMRIASFTAETPRDERKRISDDLDKGSLQGLVAIRCLDEGVDIPSTDKAVILASSTNPRQFIQRRGRVLRKPTKDSKKIAEIYDMITMPPVDTTGTEAERTMLRKELVRFAEFAALARNAGEARLVIIELQKKYDLMDI